MASNARSPSLWRMLVVVGVAVLVAGALFAWSSSLFPLLAGFLLAYLTHPLASFFERYRMPRILGFLAILLLFSGILVLIFFVFVPALINELVVIGEKTAVVAGGDAGADHADARRPQSTLPAGVCVAGGSHQHLGPDHRAEHGGPPGEPSRRSAGLLPERCRCAAEPGFDPGDRGLPYRRLQPFHRLAAASCAQAGAAHGGPGRWRRPRGAQLLRARPAPGLSRPRRDVHGRAAAGPGAAGVGDRAPRGPAVTGAVPWPGRGRGRLVLPGVLRVPGPRAPARGVGGVPGRPERRGMGAHAQPAWQERRPAPGLGAGLPAHRR